MIEETHEQLKASLAEEISIQEEWVDIVSTTAGKRFKEANDKAIEFLVAGLESCPVNKFSIVRMELTLRRQQQKYINDCIDGTFVKIAREALAEFEAENALLIGGVE